MFSLGTARLSVIPVTGFIFLPYFNPPHDILDKASNLQVNLLSETIAWQKNDWFTTGVGTPSAFPVIFWLSSSPSQVRDKGLGIAFPVVSPQLPSTPLKLKTKKKTAYFPAAPIGGLAPSLGKNHAVGTKQLGALDWFMS